MISSDILKQIISIYIPIPLVLTGLIGMLVAAGPDDNNNIEAAIITLDVNGQGDYISLQEASDEYNTNDNEKITTTNLSNPTYIHWNLNPQVDNLTLNYECFPINVPPNQTSLVSPLNNSYINNSTPFLTWSAGSDPDNDTLSYFVQIDENGGDWSILIAENHSEIGRTNWKVNKTLPDGIYQWRVRANDSFENGSWSDIWWFTIDTGIPIANKPNCHCIFNNTGTLNWTWIKSADTGSGIKGYYIYIGTMPSGTNIVNGEWTTNNWYKSTNLLDGSTYYCGIKTENGAGTFSYINSSNDGVLIDLDIPFVNQPRVPGAFNNTGIVKWTWKASIDTGSGIIGYYVYIGTSIGASDVINGEFSVNKWYEKNELLDDNTYYCRIRVVNGAGTISDFSSSSVGIHVDLDTPECSTPVSTVKYNNTGRVIWTWPPAPDTGSGIAGYYVTITKAPTDTIVVDNVWTTNNYFEKSLLQDGNVYYCRIKAENGAGTIGECSASSTGVYIDLITPKSPIGIYADPASWTSVNSFKFSWTNPNDFSGIAGAYYKIDSTPKNNKDGRFLFTDEIDELLNISFAEDGEHIIYVWLMDHAGNVNYQNSASTTVYLDTEPPQPPISVEVTPSDWSSINSFFIDWALPVDLSGVKTGVYYYLGDAPPTSQAQGTWTNNKPIKITGVPEGENKVYLWLEDVAGNRDYKNFGNAILRLDAEKPSIKHTPVTREIEGLDIIISANITDNNAGVRDAILYFKGTSFDSYTELEMNLKFGTNTYSIKIPSREVTPDGLEYYLKVRDNANPTNIVYFGYNGETSIQPNTDTDIDIYIPIQPEVIRASPKGSDLSVYSQINITFNKQMNKESAEKAFSINPSVTGSFSWEGNKLIFTPNLPLTYQTKYTVSLSKNASDQGGLPLLEVLKFSFSTELEPDDIEPEDKKEDKEDQTLIIAIVAVVVIILLVVIVLFMVMSKNKKKEEERRKQEEAEKAKKAALKPKIELIVSDQSARATFICQNCGATIPEADRCKFCGWTRHM
jgi:hypothetical protein